MPSQMHQQSPIFGDQFLGIGAASSAAGDDPCQVAGRELRRAVIGNEDHEERGPNAKRFPIGDDPVGMVRQAFQNDSCPSDLLCTGSLTACRGAPKRVMTASDRTLIATWTICVSAALSKVPRSDGSVDHTDTVTVTSSSSTLDATIDGPRPVVEVRVGPTIDARYRHIGVRSMPAFSRINSCKL